MAALVALALALVAVAVVALSRRARHGRIDETIGH
jgi:hypothetical protein